MAVEPVMVKMNQNSDTGWGRWDTGLCTQASVSCCRGGSVGVWSCLTVCVLRCWKFIFNPSVCLILQNVVCLGHKLGLLLCSCCWQNTVSCDITGDLLLEYLQKINRQDVTQESHRSQKKLLFESDLTRSSTVVSLWYHNLQNTSQDCIFQKTLKMEWITFFFRQKKNTSLCVCIHLSKPI